MTALEQLAVMETEALKIEREKGPSRELLLIRCIITFLKLHVQQHQQTRRSNERPRAI